VLSEDVLNNLLWVNNWFSLLNSGEVRIKARMKAGNKVGVKVWLKVSVRIKVLALLTPDT